MIPLITATVVMLVIGATTFRTATLALFATVCFVTTPVVWAAAPAQLLELLALLCWMLLLLRVDRNSGAWQWAALGAILGLGAYAHTSALVTMPLLLVAGAVIVAARGDVGWLDRRLGIMLLAAAVVTTPLILRVSDRAEIDRLALRYGLYDATRFNPLQGVREVFSWVGLVARSDVYHRYFDPAFLFLSGDSLRQAIVSPAVFLMPLMVLVPIGLWAAVAGHPRPREAAILWSALIIPVAPALTAQAPAASRALLLAPYAALLAVRGAHQLISSPRAGWRYAGFAAAASVPLFWALRLIN